MAGNERFRALLLETADALGMSPNVLATIISYETAGTFSPTIKGPTTKWGQHRGLIQFGEPQARRYGADFSSPEAALESQLGANGAVVRYFREHGWREGMSELDAYSIVNAGAPGRYGASDTAAGGAPGSVRDKVEQQFGPHRSKAASLLGGEFGAIDLAAGSGGDGPRGPDRRAFADQYGLPDDRIRSIYDAYVSGQMTPEDAAQYEADVMAGRIATPEIDPASKFTNPEQEERLFLAYSTGQMTPEDRAQYEQDVQFGFVGVPDNPSELLSTLPPVGASQSAPSAPLATASRGSAGRREARDNLPDQSDVGADLLRGVGLGARNVAQGVAGLADILYEPAAAVTNAALGTEIPTLRTQAESALTDLGLPQPETAAERVLGQVQEGAAGAIAGVGAGAAIGRAAPTAARFLAEQPIGQVVGGGAAGGGGQMAAEAGAGAAGQVAAALAGGATGGAAGSRSLDVRGAPSGSAIAVPSGGGSSASRGSAGRREARMADPRSDEEMEAIGTLIARAGRGDQAAMQRLVAMARTNPEVAQAADRLGVNLPADVFSDNTAVQMAAGAVRSVKGNEAAADWVNQLSAAQTQARNVLQGAGASSGDVVSSGVRARLESSIKQLDDEASPIYARVRGGLNGREQVDVSAIVQHLNQELGDLGNQVNAMTDAERRLYDVATTPGAATYTRIIRERRQIGQALSERTGPYKDEQRARLSQLYGILKDVEAEHVARVASPEAVEELARADELFRSARQLEDDLSKGFGRDYNGSIATRIRTMISSASRTGDDRTFRQIMSVVPEDMQSEAVLTGIWENARTGDHMSFSKFATTYAGLREHPQAFAQIVEVIGPEAADTLNAMYQVARRVEQASGRVNTGTGSSNQALMRGLESRGLMDRFVAGPARAAGRAAAGTVGAMTGGAIGGAAVSSIASEMAHQSPRKLEATAALLRNPRFLSMMEQAAANGQPTMGTLRAVQRSDDYKRWARAFGIPKPDEWLVGTMAGTGIMSQNSPELEELKQDLGAYLAETTGAN